VPPTHDLWRIDGTHIFTSTRLIAAIIVSAPGLGSPLPHLCRDPIHRCDMFAGTWIIPSTSAATRLIAATTALGLDLLLSHLRRDWARRCHTCAANRLTAFICAHCFHLCAGTPLTAVACALELDSPIPHLRHDCARDSAHHCDISPGSRLTCAGTGLTASACTSRLSSPLSQFCLTRLASTTSAPRLGSLLPQLRRTRTHHCDICSGD
jgi:hypothetical protein